jgi:taurine--2-oxoglutarate transaminase
MINTLIIAPPVGIAEADIDEAVDALDSALEVSDDAMEG